MSKVLKRKLFRHKYQIATNQVPGALLGGILPALGAVGRYTVKPVFNALSAAARTRLGGAGILGLETVGAGKGAYDVGTGLIEGDRDKTLTGLSEIGLSAPFIPGSFRGAKEAFEKKGVPFFKETGKKVGKGIESLAQKAAKIPGADVVGRNPIKSAIVGAGLPFGANVLADQNENSAMAADQQLQNIFGDRTPPESQMDAIAQENLDEEMQKIEAEQLTKTGLVNDNVQKTEDLYTKRINNAENLDEFANNDDPEFIVNKDKIVETIKDNVVLNIGDASDAAKDLLITKDNPMGDKKKAGSVSTDPLDLPDINFALSKTERDFSNSQKAIDEYEKFIQDKKDSKQSFEEYKAKYKAMIGDDNSSKMYRDLALLKWASRMMTGKTAQAGINGFFDVLGQSTEPLADDIMAIDMNERQKNKALVDQYLEYEQALNDSVDTLTVDSIKDKITRMSDFEKSKYQNTEDYKERLLDYFKTRDEYNLELQKLKDDHFAKINSTENQEYYLAPDPMGLFPNSKKIVKIGDNKFGQPMIQQSIPMQRPDGSTAFTTQYLPYQGDMSLLTPVDVKGNQSQKAKIMDQINSLYQGIKFEQEIAKIAALPGGKEFFGTKGQILDFTTNFQGVFRDFGFGEGEQVFTDLISYSDNFDGLNAFVQFNSEPAEADEIQAMLNKDIEDALNKENIMKAAKARGLDPEDKVVIDALSKLRIIETRMKYIIANANKGQDRLTVRDVEDAGKRTEIFGLLKSSERIISNYEELGRQLNATLIKRLKDLEDIGGNASKVAEDFGDIPIIKKLQESRKKRMQRMQGFVAPEVKEEQQKSTKEKIEKLDLRKNILE